MEKCICESNSFFVKNGRFVCSYCKKPSGVKMSDLKPLDMAKKEDCQLIKDKLKRLENLEKGSTE